VPTPFPLIGLGMATLDILIRAESMSVWHSGMTLDGLSIESGGMACNAMFAAAKLGIQTGFIGSIGNDRLGMLKHALLQESGLDISRCIIHSAPDDQVVMVHIDSKTGERNFYPLAAPHRRQIDPLELDRSYILQADYLHIDGFHPLASLQAARWMGEAGKQVMLDVNAHHGPPSAEIITLIQHVHFLVCSSGFLQVLAQTDDAAKAAKTVLEMGPHTIVQTEGERGSITFTRNFSFKTPAYPVRTVDTTGAGDVFHGAYLVGLLQGWDLQKISWFASIAAALKCQKLGREGYPTYQEVWNHWQAHPNPEDFVR